MLQDLSFGKLRNEFKNKKPHENDSVFVFSNGGILICRDGDDLLSLPSYSELGSLDKKRFQYVFSLQDVDYFLYMGESEIKTDKYLFEPVRTLRQLKSKEICFAVMTGWHLFSWYKSNKFCGRCGAETVHDEKERMLKCPDCGNMIYPKISPAVIIAVTDGERLLLSKYAGRTYTRFALLAGYTEIGETLEETVKREVMEEVGLKVKNIRYYKSQPWGVDGNILMGFYCDLDGDDKISIDVSELSMAAWYERGNIPAEDDGISLTREMIRIFNEGKQP